MSIKILQQFINEIWTKDIDKNFEALKMYKKVKQNRKRALPGSNSK